VSKQKRPPSPRAARRALARADAKLSRDRERLATFEPGGSPERPLVVESASQIEPHASSTSCLHCGTAYRVLDHTAESIRGAAVRVVRARCPYCGADRTLFFAIRSRQLN
jgi:hypothetical protein